MTQQSADKSKDNPYRGEDVPEGVFVTAAVVTLGSYAVAQKFFPEEYAMAKHFIEESIPDLQTMKNNAVSIGSVLAGGLCASVVVIAYNIGNMIKKRPAP